MHKQSYKLARFFRMCNIHWRFVAVITAVIIIPVIIAAITEAITIIAITIIVIIIIATTATTMQSLLPLGTTD